MASDEHTSDAAVTRWTRASVYPDMWVDPGDDPRETDAEVVDERGALLDCLRHFRLTLEMKCAGLDAGQLYRTDEDRDGDWTGAVADQAVVDEAWRQWRTEVERTDRYLDGATDLAATNTGFSELGPEPGGRLLLRDVLLAQIAEYARHCGHADLLRERIDGRVGQ
ncbi:DUF664 domain-containing protein [Streptomyces sp. NPDC006372]|uniref:mycothiol transferase n=1 Tax=Streptomyces sp. NPDC006372 TaxID=3155599 RepID=UPI0033A7A66B